MHFGRKDPAESVENGRPFLAAVVYVETFPFAKRTSHFTIDKHNSKEIHMKFDVPNFNTPWKISLEDHYQTLDTLESAARYATGSKEAWQRLSSNLLDFTKQRVEQMDETGIELAILSLAPGIEEI